MKINILAFIYTLKNPFITPFLHLFVDNFSFWLQVGLRLLEAEEQKFYALKSAIEEGIESGIAVDFEPNEFLEQMKRERSKNG